MPTKICSDCRQEKQISEFGSDKSRASGVAFYCKLCTNARYRKRYLDKSIPKNRGKSVSKVARQKRIVKYGIDIAEILDRLPSEYDY